VEALEEINIQEWLKTKPSKLELNNKFWELVEEEPKSSKVIASKMIEFYGVDRWEYTLLHEACSLDNVDAVKLLIEVGFDKNAYFEMIDHCSDRRGTPLTEALDNCADDVISYLLTLDDIDATTKGHNKSDGEYWESGYDIISLNKLFDTPYFDRLIELGVTLEDSDEDDSLLWVAFNNNDLPMFKKLVNLGADLNIEGNDGYLIEQVLSQYLLNNKSEYLAVLKFMVKSGADLNVTCIDYRSIVFEILDSYDDDLISILGINKTDLEEISERYEKPLPKFPYELFDVNINSEDVVKCIASALLDGYYGWQKPKLIRIMNLAISVIIEEHGEDYPNFDKINRTMQNLDEAQINYFLRENERDVKVLDDEFREFITSLEKEGKLENPSKSLHLDLERIGHKIHEMKDELHKA